MTTDAINVTVIRAAPIRPGDTLIIGLPAHRQFTAEQVGMICDAVLDNLPEIGDVLVMHGATVEGVYQPEVPA
jgi:hypothetical protein